MKVKINSKSWHYRWYTLLNNIEPTNLCGYFWFVLLSILIIVLVSSAVLGFAILVAVKLFTWDWQWLQGIGIGLGVLVVMFALIAGLSLGIEKVARFVKGKLPKKQQPSSFWKVTKEFVKAKKSRFCPIIEVIRE